MEKPSRISKLLGGGFFAFGVKEKMVELQNASQLPRIFYARHMQPGICKYEDEVVLVDTDCLKKMIPTGVAIPVYINHQKVDLAKMKEEAAGYITESFYNELDGWAWFKFLAIDDECHLAIQAGWKVSNAYIGDGFAAGGTKNNCPYDREIIDGHFTHLAIVENPRYEGACIMSSERFKEYQDNLKQQLIEHQNSKPVITKPAKEKPMFKLFKNTKEEVSTIDADTMIDLGNGKSVSFEEMLNSVKKKNEAEPEKELINGDTEVDVDGEKMPLKELVNRYNAMCAKQNEADKEAEEKKNAEEAAAKEEEEKKNSLAKAEDEKGIKFFEELRNAHEEATKSTSVKIEAPKNALERGKKRY